MEGIGVVLVEPVVAVEEVELLAPKHAGEGLAHHHGRVRAHRRRRDRLVKLIGFTQPAREDVVEFYSEGRVDPVRGTAGDPQSNHLGLAGADIELIVRRDLAALLAGVDRLLTPIDDTVVDPVLHVGTLVFLSGEQPLVVGFVFGEQQRHLALAGKDELA